MRSLFGLVLVAGLGLAGTAVYMVRGYMAEQALALEAQRQAAAAAVPTVNVIAAKRTLLYGERITPDDIMFVRYAEPFLPEGVFRSVEELFPQGPNVQRAVLRQMEPNEPLLAVKVTAPGEDAGLVARLSPGMRAFAVSVDVASGVAGFLRPGDRVDVYWTGQAPERGDVTQLIETGLRLVAIDQIADAHLSGVLVPRTVTVEASPQQVAKLALAQSTGKLSLSLVGQGDSLVAAAVEVDRRAMLGIEEEAAPSVEIAPPPPPVCTVRTRRGAEVVETPVDCPTN
ncbi:Flp pilus assembly protein CpaB [Rubellimicrobium sp. CFH 75288]|uniref:Flp pilus assembly protein CpaB n=1 Tax=Rubellimicrobium sp. CFH 75288 TaxID=2697034 RepID=UPI0014136EF3|nr:Flp pilus assembly protein CpaB [Rubellimicrobium sp. CFH 75288]NAZ35621.1 Flp pilus assembly protein CpaB [Rubellimicrobium sp. CFH 75288]